MKNSDKDTYTPEQEIPTKKTYSKPCTLSKEKLEVMAVICSSGKADAGTCSSGPITS